jgi:hypothetical protein
MEKGVNEAIMPLADSKYTDPFTPISGLSTSTAYLPKSGCPRKLNPVPSHTPLAPSPLLTTTALEAGTCASHALPLGKVTQMKMLSMPEMGPRRGKERLVAVKKVMTTLDLREGEATSKYHQSGVVALTGWSLGASRELVEDVKEE